MDMRRKDREVTDLTQIEDILKHAKILHLGLTDEEGLYVVPLHYAYVLENGKLTFYVHGASDGRKYRIAAKGGAAFVEVDTGATLLSGGDDPCRYGAAFHSVMGPGQVSLVTGQEEKITALQLLMKQQTGRDFAMTAKMADSVSVIKVALDSFTAKSKEAPGTIGEKEAQKPFADMDNHELFCVLTGDYGVIAQAQLQRILNKYRAKHHILDKDMKTMVEEILRGDA